MPTFLCLHHGKAVIQAFRPELAEMRERYASEIEIPIASKPDILAAPLHINIQTDHQVCHWSKLVSCFL